MIYPAKNSLVYWFFSKYLPFIIRRNFEAINFDPVEIENDKSLLVLSNHFGWWDAFLMYYVFKKITGKKLYVMVLEETMKQHGFLKHIGAFSVVKSPRESMEAINYAAQLLNDPQNLVLIFPQGKLYSNFVSDMQFEKGAVPIMDKAEDKFQLVYATTFTENFQHQKPTANVYLSKPIIGKFENIDALTQSYQQHYNDARAKQTQIII